MPLGLILAHTYISNSRVSTTLALAILLKMNFMRIFPPFVNMKYVDGSHLYTYNINGQLLA